MTDKILQDLDSMRQIVSQIECGLSNSIPFTFLIKEHKESPYMQIVFDAADNDGGPVVRQFCRKWPLQYTMAKSEVVRTAHKAARAAYEHECDEMFTYKGHAIYNPHTDVDRLVEMQKSTVWIDIRIPK